MSDKDPFADDVLERLIASNQDYQRAHGHYIVPLSERLLEARAALEQAERRAERGADAETEKIERGTEIQRLRTRLSHEWNEDELLPRVGYAMLTSEDALIALPEFPFAPVRTGDILHYTIITNRYAERPDEDVDAQA